MAFVFGVNFIISLGYKTNYGCGGIAKEAAFYAISKMNFYLMYAYRTL
jgi:hypothetical protein